MNNILHLRYAVEVEKTGSISKAAENLYMTQPHLSKAIKELEASLGITIFTRNSRGVSVTSKGAEFLVYAKKIICQVDEMQKLYDRPEQKNVRTFAVCVPRASYISWSFAKMAKDLMLKSTNSLFREAGSMEAIKLVVEGISNTAIIRYPTAFEKYFLNLLDRKELAFLEILKFRYSALMSKAHPLAQQHHVNYTELWSYPEVVHSDWVVPAMPMAAHKSLEQTQGGKKTIGVYERGSQFEILNSVETAFMWASPVPKHVLDSLSLIQIKCKESINYYKDILIYKRDYKLSEDDLLFIAKLKEMLQTTTVQFESV